MSFSGNKLNLTVTNMITNEVMSNLNMFGFEVLNLIFCEIYCTCVVQNKGTLRTFNPKSSSCCLIHKIRAQQLLVAIYSASVVDKATQACFLLCHDIRLEPSRWHVPLVLFLSNLHPAKSESEYPTK